MPARCGTVRLFVESNGITQRKGCSRNDEKTKAVPASAGDSALCAAAGRRVRFGGFRVGRRLRPVGEAFSTTEYVLNRDDDYYHFSSITDVQIRGYIGGDLIGFSYAPKVSATIDGNLRFAATALEVTGDVARSITVACGEATLAASSKSVYFIGDSLYFSGSTGDLTAEALEVSLSGRVDGDVNVQADRVTFLNGFSCTGSIRVTAKEVEFGPVDAAVVEWQR